MMTGMVTPQKQTNNRTANGPFSNKMAIVVVSSVRLREQELVGKRPPRLLLDG